MNKEEPQVVNGEMRFPVSVKGVVVDHGCVLLVKNEREEWELPGGKLELGETPEVCVVREVEEEAAWMVQTEALLDAWVYTIFEGRHVLILSYGCTVVTRTEDLSSPEGKDLVLVPLAEVDALNMPNGYKASIASWGQRLAKAP